MAPSCPHRRSLAVCVLGLALLLGASHGHAWRAEYQGGSAADAGLDGAGSVVASGTIGGSFAVVKLSGSTGAEQWVAQVDPGYAYAVTIDGNDDVIAAGILGTFAVVKLDGATGAELWRWNSATFGLALDVAVDAAGDVIASGRVTPGSDDAVNIAKLAGPTGALLWETQVLYPGANAEASAVEADGLGNVLATGYVSVFPDGDLLILKLDGSTGGELWRHEIAESYEFGNALVLASGGDAIVAGQLDGQPAVVRYASATGTEVWRGVGPGLNGFEDVALDPMGNVAAAGFRSPAMLVARFDGVTGGLLWSQELTRSVNGYGYGVAVDGTGDIYTTGYLEGAASGPDFAVVRLDGATGDTRWRQFLDGSAAAPSALDRGFKVLVDAAGGVVAAGSMLNDSNVAFAVFRLDGLDGAVGPVSGLSIKVNDHATDPTARRVLMTARDVAIVVPPEGSAGDPTLGGGTLRVVNPVTLEQATFAVPASGWAPVGGARSRGYAYSDPSGANGPCRKIRIQPGRMRAVCTGTQGPIPFTLDEPSQGTLAITVTLGTSDPQCAVFGTNIRRDQGTANPGPQGVFQARLVLPALGTCP